jgi:hypothetical protein
MPRFVILEHDWPALHWDLMLEVGDVLFTWRLAAPPVPARAVAAEKTADHRKMYLDYEGPVSGGRGTVTRWDAGTFEWLEDVDKCKVVRLAGQRVSGTLRLEHSSGEKWESILEGRDSSEPEA